MMRAVTQTAAIIFVLPLSLLLAIALGVLFYAGFVAESHARINRQETS